MIGTVTTYLFPIAAAAAPKGDKGGEDVFPPFDPTYFPSQIFWFLLSFLVLYFLLSKVFLPRVAETLEERSSRIADDLDSASRMQREAEEAEKAYIQSLADARAKAHNVADTTRQAVEAEVAAELAVADADAAQQAEAAEARIRIVRTEALSNIESIATDAAQAVVEKLTGKKITAAAVKKVLG